MHMVKTVRRLETENWVVELWPKAAYDVQATSDRAVIGFAFEAQSGMDAIGTGKARSFLRRPNTLSWVPGKCPVFSRSDEGGEYLVLRGMPSVMIGHREAGERPLNAIVDPDAVAAACSLRRRLLSGEREIASEPDILAAVLLRHFTSGKAAAPWITAARLAAIDRLIDRHMGERLAIARLAAELELSVGFLVRAFRQSLGVTPHRYVMERRLAQARRLLDAGCPIADTAAECGFADQAHLTRHLKRSTGVTPAYYERMEK
ncbi:helix-turn-helix domain-containing protein [Komagataeibacter sp. FNDCF1]|uniref:helix-turn-helix domain-containing protein n=1 Tax=Komagataeibacter sp. FNDCF1 TaxID=2878681 RepID=UPI001E515C60|nr:AraC family transcriptional regulator [Komagataeibacter sp. FNDCF1]MCE2564787.1 AraC family transcriptional regulator [Komagataeibacter sp. FNDCF1]